jgi:hypothetical protein
MVPMQKLLECIKCRKPSEYPQEGRDVTLSFVNALREHVQECTTQETASGECHQRQHDFVESVLVHYERYAPHECDGTHDESARNDPE